MEKVALLLQVVDDRYMTGSTIIVSYDRQLKIVPRRRTIAVQLRRNKIDHPLSNRDYGANEKALMAEEMKEDGTAYFFMCKLKMQGIT